MLVSHIANTHTFIFPWQIFCAKCESTDLAADNDIILCDGACERGFHQFCLQPPLLKDDSMSKPTLNSSQLHIFYLFWNSLLCSCFYLLFFLPSTNHFPSHFQFLLVMRAGFALDVIVRLTALHCSMILKELIFLFWTHGRSISNSRFHDWMDD